MKTSVHKNNQGIAHVAIILVVLVVAVVAGVGYYVLTKQKSGSSSNSLTDAVKQAAAKCDYDDKNLCKFFSSWKDSKYYTLTSSSMTDGKTSTMKMEYVAPDRYHMVMGGDVAYETITIGDVVYTKDNADNKWWKQTPSKVEADKVKEEAKVDFEEPTKEAKPEEKTTYKFIAKEACGKLSCFKYQVIDPKAKDTTSYIWFDDKDFQLRKTRDETKEGAYEATFSYDKIEIKEPSPTKDMPANQSVVPGGTIPMDGPTQAELEAAAAAAGQ